MKAIETKYFGATNTKPARLKATTREKGQTVWMSYDSSLSSNQNHGLAARMLCVAYNWRGDLIGGGFPDGTMVWVFDSGASPTA